MKVHVQYSIGDECPTYFFITNAKEHENNTMEDMDLKKGDRVTMDRGYFNAAEFHRMCCAGIEFITRMKSNVQPSVSI
ncbi:MAG: transposase [Treponema sp.]|nr:transposase [Treponema sp.]